MFKNLRGILYILSFLCCIFTASAQSSSTIVIDASSLEPVNADPITGLALDPIGKDRSNRPCARIKLHINRMTAEEISNLEVRPIGGNVLVMRSQVAYEGNGLIIEITAKPQTRFYLHHDRLGDSNPVTLNLEGDKEYRLEAWNEQMFSITVLCDKPGAEVYLDESFKGYIGSDNHLTVQDVTVGGHKLEVRSAQDQHMRHIEVSPESVFFNMELKRSAQLQGFVVFKVEPSNALVEFDGEPLFLNSEGQAQKLVRYGSYSYSVSAKGYHTSVGEVVVDSGKVTQEITLKPSHGWINVSGGNTDGAYVYVDSELIGQAPLTTDQLAAGTYKVRILKQMFETYETDVVVDDGQTVHISPELNSNFSTVTLTADDGVEIWVNGELKGTGMWSGDLSSGDYLVECRKDNHRPTSEVITISQGMEQTPIRLTSPEPICGILSITSDPMDASVFIDGNMVGKTPLYLTDVLVGSREVRVAMDDYQEKLEIVTINEGEVTEIAAVLGTKGSGRKAKTRPQIQLQPENAPVPEKVSKPERKPQQTSGSVLAMASVGVYPQMSYGLMLGYVKKFGGYVKFRSNFNFSTASYGCFSSGLTDSGDQLYTSGSSPRYSRIQATGGLLLSLSKNIYPYAGVGYGTRGVQWEDYAGEWAQVTDYTYKGIAAEAGVTFKFGVLSLSVGASTTAFKYSDLELGIGLMF